MKCVFAWVAMFSVLLLAASYSHGQAPEAVLIPLDGGEVGQVRAGDPLFTDRTYVITDWPAFLQGRPFIRSPIRQSKAKVLRDGVVFVLTPQGGKISQRPVLLESGFERVAVEPFVPFRGGLDDGRDRCDVFQKRVTAGDEIAYGFYGVTVWSNEVMPVDAHTSESTATAELWTSAAAFPAVEEIPHVPGIQYVTIHRGSAGKDQFLHESGLIHHGGELYAAWVSGLQDEAADDGVIRGRVSRDGGRTWSAPQTIAPLLNGPERWEYASFASIEDRLWMFSTRCRDAWEFAQPKLEAFVLGGDSTWTRRGVVAEDFVATDEPRRMDNRRWILAGMFRGRNRIAISAPDDLTTWEMTEIPHAEGLRWPLVSLVLDGPKIMAIMRNSRERYALVSHSDDFGATWSEATQSNLPMEASKPFAGVLSTGQMFLVSNTPGRHPRGSLTIAVSRPGERVFSGIWHIRGLKAPPLQWPGRAKSPQWSYPKAIEHDGKLYVSYSVGKEDCELAILPVASLVLP